MKKTIITLLFAGVLSIVPAVNAFADDNPTPEPTETTSEVAPEVEEPTPEVVPFDPEVFPFEGDQGPLYPCGMFARTNTCYTLDGENGIVLTTIPPAPAPVHLSHVAPAVTATQVVPSVVVQIVVKTGLAFEWKTGL